MRRLPPPPKQPSAPILFVAVIVAILLGLTMLAGIAWVALWVAGLSEVLTMRRALGIAVGLFLYRIFDKVFARRSASNDLHD